MKRIFLIVLLTLLSSVILYSQQDKPIITVLDMETNGISEAEMRTVISILSSALFKTGYFIVIDVSQRETVLQELEFSLSGCSDDSCMLEVGKLLSAEAVVVGKIGRIGNKYVISVKMLETETARTLSSADGLYPDIDGLLENIYEIAAELALPNSSASAAATKIEVASEAEVVQAEELSEAETESDKSVEPSGLNIPAIATLSGGLISAGVGTYFLAVSLPLIFDYLDAKSAYELESDPSADYLLLWDNFENSRIAAADGNANTNLILGASLAGVGVILSTVSIFLFSGGSK